MSDPITAPMPAAPRKTTDEDAEREKQLDAIAAAAAAGLEAEKKRAEEVAREEEARLSRFKPLKLEK